MKLTPRTAKKYTSLITNRTFRRVGIFCLLIILWQVYVSVSQVPALLIPTPLSVLQVLIQDLLSQKLLQSTLSTLSILCTGMLAGVILGTGLAAFAKVSRFGQDLLVVLSSMFNPLPAIAILPLVIIWFGFTPLSIIVVTAHATTWPIALNTETGLSTINPTVLMVGKNLGLKGFRLVREIMLPAALPHILTGWKTAWAFGWRTVIAAELVFGTGGAAGGLGWHINYSRYFLQTDRVFAGLVVIASLGLAVNYLFHLIELRTVDKWGMKHS
ncbi:MULTISPECIES: ABC transporter permease [unclassified Tolypothrix]|uniref:ABC transporter permease n=1 Tax=unclassified Tolypothrix TaxID=2649714 RepID=UPI0005F83391|nr:MULTISPECIES: ABC transporter permease [unclassified Tolypothrix]MBE9085360.1 ABC transporter permease [Tolypothrix sp. LEGE 11397]UYD29356.1 ABC transporter permease [Tolypothrix sp. PCC 7712]UYD34737.1 ABC transporter permease [Tolypothrix sp. PCC 7601]BAY88687.1 binding-protein-dependent transport systems inner membrane component [Microchaete diplosiphon NIES-3275]